MAVTGRSVPKCRGFLSVILSKAKDLREAILRQRRCSNRNLPLRVFPLRSA